MQIGHIIRGWGMRFGLIRILPAEQKLAELRVKICTSCPFHKHSNILRIINNEVTNNAEVYCTKCTCPSYEKGLIVEEKCPENFW